MISVHKKDILTVALFYAIPRVVGYLCTRPTDLAASRVFDRFRNQMSSIQESIRTQIGEKCYFIISNIIVDNAWISAIAILYLTGSRNIGSSFDRIVDIGAGIAGVATMAWLIRSGIVRVCPSLTPYIGPKTF